MEVTRYGRPYQLRAADGTIQWLGAALVCGERQVLNNEASATIAPGEAVRFDVTTAAWPRWDYAASDEPIVISNSGPTGQDFVIKGLRVSAAANVGFLGVATQSIAVAKTGMICGPGSLVSVKCLASPTSSTAGAQVIGSSTAGFVDMVGPNAAGSATSAPAGGTVLGRLLLPPGTGANQTGSTTQAGIVVALG